MSIQSKPIPPIFSVDVWSIQLQSGHQDIHSFDSILDDDELQRYQKLHNRHKLRYLISHLACRDILARYTDIPRSELVYSKNAHGKPYIQHPSLKFNLSHSHDLALLAIANQAEIGIDVEYRKTKPSWEKIAKRFFTVEENNYLNSFSDAEREQQFFQLWTRKEAYIKAIGTGLTTPMSSFDACHPDVIQPGKKLEPLQVWYLQDIAVEKPYAASIVQNTRIEKIRYYSYDKNKLILL